MFRRPLTVALAALAVVGVTALPAAADPNPPYTPTTIDVYGVTAGVFVSGLQINATCTATVTGAVAATVIDECRIYQEGWPDANHPSALPGNATASNFTQRVHTLDFVLCFSAYTIPLHDPTKIVRASGCAYEIMPGSDGGVTLGSGSTPVEPRRRPPGVHPARRADACPPHAPVGVRIGVRSPSPRCGHRNRVAFSRQP